MAALFAQVTHWHWWIFAVVLLVLEAFAPGAFFLWSALSAFAVGVLVLLFPLGWQVQLLLFALLSVATILAWRAYLASQPPKEPAGALNRRGEHYIGRTFVLTEPITNGFGKLRVDDSIWKVEGQDCPAGTSVRVTGVDGTVLRVEVFVP